MLWELSKKADVYMLRTGRIRSNSVVRDRSWVAEITGLGGEYGMIRTFIRSQHDVYGNRDGEQMFLPLYEGRVYEYRNVWRGDSAHQYLKGRSANGFFRIEMGKEIEMAAADVAEFLSSAKSPMHREIVGQPS